MLELRNKSVNEQAGKSQEKIEEKDANECNTRSMTEETLDSDANDGNLRSKGLSEHVICRVSPLSFLCLIVESHVSWLPGLSTISLAILSFVLCSWFDTLRIFP